MTATGARLVAWVRRHLLSVAVIASVATFVAGLILVSVELYRERQQRVREQCEAINNTNGTVRFILDAGLRFRSDPISEGLRLAYIDAYRRLPAIDCASGARTYFDPPFQPAHVPE